MASNSSQSTNEEINIRYQKQMKAGIEQLHKDFAYGIRIGGIRAKDFPNHLQSHADQNFKTSQTIENFTSELYNSVKSAKQLCDLSLAFPDDEETRSKELPNGSWADVVCQIRRLIELWLRMDEVLAHLAQATCEKEQQSELGSGNGSGNTVATTSSSSSSLSSREGLTIIQDDIYATSLHQYLKMLDLSVGGDYLVQIFDWCNPTNSLITIFHEAMSREDKKPKWKGRSAEVSK